MNRRQFTRALILGGTAMVLPSCAIKGNGIDASLFPPLQKQELPFLGLATSLYEEHDYIAHIDGRIPAEIRGTLYRNGPGLFERAGMRKRALLDGDGMLQLFRFGPDGVRYVNRYVQTEKYLEEQKAGRYLHPTLSTRSPEGYFANVGGAGKVKTQAGVNVFMREGLLYAFDESCVAMIIDPSDLDTLGQTTFGLGKDEAFFSAHPKIDPDTDEWLHFGLQYGPRIFLHINVFDSLGKRTSSKSLRLPRPVYMHDWFVTKEHFVFFLHPLEIGVFGLLTGLTSIADSFKWKPDNGATILVIDRHGDAPARWIEAPAAFMWHGINAFSDNGVITMDSVAFDSPDHFMGESSPVSMTMRGKMGTFKHAGIITRHTISPGTKTAAVMKMDGAGYEWPFVNTPSRFKPYRYAYLTKSRDGEFFWSGIARRDMITGAEQGYDFGAGIYCTEPVFVPAPNHIYAVEGTKEPGWIMTEGYDGNTKKAFLAILDAEDLAGGPVAIVRLEHHVPHSFHGFWRPDI